MEIEVIYMDNHLLVMNKPAGMLTQSDDSGDPDVLNWGKQFLADTFKKPGRVFLGMVHRLDRPVSGVIVFARTSKAASRLSEQFRCLATKKSYLAVVEGHLSGNGYMEDHLYKESQRLVRIVSAKHPKGKFARLTWEAVAYQQGLSLVLVHLETGRPHQIRIQFSHRGFPIVGDRRYGAKAQDFNPNIALHSFCLKIKHPTRDEELTFRAPPPPQWADLPFGPEINAAL